MEKKLKRLPFTLMFSLVLSACGGGSNGNASLSAPSQSASKSVQPRAKFSIPRQAYGNGWAPECQTANIRTVSVNPMGSIIMGVSGASGSTGNPYNPEPAGYYTPYCASSMSGHINASDWQVGRYDVQIDSESPVTTVQNSDGFAAGPAGAVVYAQMPCAAYGQSVQVNTWVTGNAATVAGWATGAQAPLANFINVPTATFNAEGKAIDTNGGISYGVGEVGGNYGLATGAGGILSPEFLVGNSGYVAGEKFVGQQHYETSCSNTTPISPGGNSVDNWELVMLDTVDTMGTSPVPVARTGLYESTWGGIFTYTFGQYVGLTQIVSITLDKNPNGSIALDANGNPHGTGWHYWAMNTANPLPGSPSGAAPQPWSN